MTQSFLICVFHNSSTSPPSFKSFLTLIMSESFFYEDLVTRNKMVALHHIAVCSHFIKTHYLVTCELFLVVVQHRLVIFEILVRPFTRRYNFRQSRHAVSDVHVSCQPSYLVADVLNGYHPSIKSLHDDLVVRQALLDDDFYCSQIRQHNHVYF